MEREFPIPKLSPEEIERIRIAFQEARPNFATDKACLDHLMTELPYSTSTLRKYGAKGGRDRHTIYTTARKVLMDEAPPPAPTIRKTLAEIDDPEKISELIKAENDTRRYQQEAKNWERRYKVLSEERDGLNDQVASILAIKDRIEPISIRAERSGKGGSAIAVVTASDWHFGAIIRPNTVNFINEVHPEITRTRIERFFQAVVKLIKKEQLHVKIDTLLLALIGDFIENYLHPELIEEATLSPIEQTQQVQDCIAGGIEYILRETELKIVCPTCPGNHGRTTPKMQAGTNYKNSLEQLMYWNLAKYFSNEPRVKFQISDSYFNYIDVFDHTLRFHHGDACRFGGGIGGLMIPLRKFIHRANQQVFADTSICGHFHSLIVDYDIMVNGSLVGPSAYSMRLGFPPERPQQILRLLDAKRGWTMFAPILVAEQEKKNGRIIG